MLNTPRLIYLVGGDEFSDLTESADQAVLQLAPAGYVAILPTASADRGPERAATNGIQYFARLGRQAESVMILSKIDAKNPEFSALIAHAAVIYFTGGSPEQLVSIVENSPVIEALMSAAQKGAIVGGSSAGAMALGPEFRCPRHGWFSGLALTSVVSVPHAETESPEVLDEIMGRVGSRPLALLPSQSACLVEPTNVTCCGTKPISLIVGGTRHQLEPKQRLELDLTQTSR